MYSNNHLNQVAMKYLLLLGALAALTWLPACRQHSTDETVVLKRKIDSLETRLANAYKPGFGEFMSGIQVHHAKLWFAGTNQNWPLADFEVHEIKETLEAIQKYQPERAETRLIPTLNPAMEAVDDAIQKRDTSAFMSSFTSLTSACNNCHRDVNYGFNQVKIPEQPPFSNQVFKPANR